MERYYHKTGRLVRENYIVSMDVGLLRANLTYYTDRLKGRESFQDGGSQARLEEPAGFNGCADNSDGSAAKSTLQQQPYFPFGLERAPKGLRPMGNWFD